jgi:hypothetical protein
MNYWRINYNKLANLKQINYFSILMVIVILFILLLIIAINTYAYHTISFYGIYNDNQLYIKIDNKLSDIVKNNDYLMFNDIKVKYKVNKFLDNEISNEGIITNISLDVDKAFLNNEVGLIKINYKRQRLIKYIFELFK